MPVPLLYRNFVSVTPPAPERLRLNRGASLARGIRRLWVPNGPNQFFDLALGKHMTVSNGTLAACPGGVGIRYDGSTTAASTTDTSDLPVGGQAVSLWFLAYCEDATIRDAITRWEPAADDWLFYSSGGLAYNNGAGRIRGPYDYTLHSFTSGLHSVSASVSSAAGAGGVLLGVDGATQVYADTDWFSDSTTSSTVTIGSRSGGTRFLGTVLAAGIWDRGLTDTELALLTTNPNALFLPYSVASSLPPNPATFSWHTAVVKVYRQD